MRHKRFTLSSYYQEIKLFPPPTKEGYDTIEEASNWCNENGVSSFDVLITEWDIKGELDAYHVPDIVAQVNLFDVLSDEAEDLRQYINY